MIGTGDVTEKKSAPSFNKIDNSQLVAVGNRTPEKAENYARRHGVPTVHRDPMDVIHDPQVEIVYVATPPGSHLLYALETIKAGKPVEIEEKENDIEKFIYIRSLFDRNVVLAHAVIASNVTQFLPIIYIEVKAKYLT